MKLTINMPLMIYWRALGEALALCHPLRLDPARVMDLLSDTSGGPNVLKVRGPAVAEMLKGRESGVVTFDIDSAIKDLRTIWPRASGGASSSPSSRNHLPVMRR